LHALFRFLRWRDQQEVCFDIPAAQGLKITGLVLFVFLVVVIFWKTALVILFRTADCNAGVKLLIPTPNQAELLEFCKFRFVPGGLWVITLFNSMAPRFATTGILSVEVASLETELRRFVAKVAHIQSVGNLAPEYKGLEMQVKTVRRRWNCFLYLSAVFDCTSLSFSLLKEIPIGRSFGATIWIFVEVFVFLVLSLMGQVAPVAFFNGQVMNQGDELINSIDAIDAGEPSVRLAAAQLLCSDAMMLRVVGVVKFTPKKFAASGCSFLFSGLVMLVIAYAASRQGPHRPPTAIYI